MKFTETTLKDAFLTELERPEDKRGFFECQNVPGVPDRTAGNLRNRRNKEMHKIMAVPHFFPLRPKGGLTFISFPTTALT